jgi:O-antigen ligase
LTLLGGAWWVLSVARPERAAYVAAYIAGSEVIWRMAKANIFWEFGKYAVVFILVLALLRNGRLRGQLLPFLFFALLLPALVFPTANVDETELRKQTSFNLSGPLALMVSTWFFSQIKLSVSQLQRMLLALIGPAVAVAFIALIGILTAKNLVFTDESNAALSGGFGPNQVSAALGLGALASFLWALDRMVQRGVRMVLLAATIFLVAQSALTFSRGGLYMAGSAAALAVLFLIRDRRRRARLLMGGGALLLALNFVLLPALDEFTGGALTRRFSDTRLTGRDDIAQSDLQVFSEHPLFGVGPGQTRHFRQHSHHDSAAAHTEFTRLLSEHGVFGLLAILLLLAMSVRHFLQARTAPGRALTASMLTWSFLFMLAGAMRLVAPAFAFGLSAVTLVPDEGEENLPDGDPLSDVRLVRPV